MDYEWDPAKAVSNERDHGVPFEHVHEFDWATARIEPDTREYYGEDRFAAAGMIRDRLHVLVFTWRGRKVRVISLRKANRRERQRYER